MIHARAVVAVGLLALALAACSPAPPKASSETAAAPTPVDPKALEAATHGAYVAAINSNDLETLMADLTDDVVYQSPNEPELVGKAAVRTWAKAYIEGYRFKWDKTSVGLTVAGDWAFERYAYKATNTDRKTGAVTTDEGKGVNVFHHDADGKWRVAIDSWNSSVSDVR